MGAGIESYVRCDPVSKRLLEARRYDMVRDALMKFTHEYFSHMNNSSA